MARAARAPKREKATKDAPAYAADVFDAAYLATVTLPNPNQIVGVAGTRDATFKATLPRITIN